MSGGPYPYKAGLLKGVLHFCAHDKVANVMWRVIHGGLPWKRHPRVLVVYVGADDLEPPFGCNDEAVEAASSRITLLLEFLRQKLPSTVIIYLAIMPHVRFQRAEGTCLNSDR